MRPAIKSASDLPQGCYCPADQCQAPVIMGKQMPCKREQTAHPLSGLHINQGSMDAAADAYEAEYLAAKESK